MWLLYALIYLTKNLYHSLIDFIYNISDIIRIYNLHYMFMYVYLSVSVLAYQQRSYSFIPNVRPSDNVSVCNVIKYILWLYVFLFQLSLGTISHPAHESVHPDYYWSCQHAGLSNRGYQDRQTFVHNCRSDFQIESSAQWVSSYFHSSFYPISNPCGEL